MAEKKEERWFEQNGKGPGYPRLWLVTGEKNLLLSWAMISQIEAWRIFYRFDFCANTGSFCWHLVNHCKDCSSVCKRKRSAELMDACSLAKLLHWSSRK